MTHTRAQMSLSLTQWSARLMSDLNWTPLDDEVYHALQDFLRRPDPNVQAPPPVFIEEGFSPSRRAIKDDKIYEAYKRAARRRGEQ